MGKKRKYELDLDVERTMYGSFVTAANSVSQLYTQAVQQQRRAAVTASRATLERVLAFVLRDPQGSDQISRSLLVQYLQHEYENLEHQDLTGPPAPVQLLPFMAPGGPTSREDPSEPLATATQQGTKPSRPLASAMASPLPRSSSMTSRDWPANMEEQHAAAVAAAGAAAGVSGGGGGRGAGGGSAAAAAGGGVPPASPHGQSHSQAVSSDMEVSHQCQQQQQHGQPHEHGHHHQQQQQQQGSMYMGLAGHGSGGLAAQHHMGSLFMGAQGGLPGR